MAAKLIVGLGNPGSQFERTYHNLGFLTIEYTAARFSARFKKKQSSALTAETYFKGSKLVFAKPQTFMNLSGDSVVPLLKSLKIEPSQLLVVYDDVDIPKGTVRFRKSGSAGTHNGMRHIIQCLGHGDFPRLRIGIGPAPDNIALYDYVLSAAKLDDFEEVFAKAADEIAAFIQDTHP